MKKGSKEMLRTILSNQELIMKALKIEVPVKPTRIQKKKEVKPAGKAKVSKASTPARKAGGKFAPKSAAHKPAGKKTVK